MTNGAPPLYGHADFRAVQVDLQVGNAVEKVSGAFYGSAVDAVLVDGVGGEGGTLGDGLADNRVGPSDGIALGVESCREAVVPHRTIPAACEIVFTRPSQEPPRPWRRAWL